MIPIYEAAWQVHRFLTLNKIPYAIIGGFAVQHWGVPRVTVDVDLTIEAPLKTGSESFVRLVLTKFRARYRDPFETARKHQIVLVAASNGRGLDISFGVPVYQNEFFRRAVKFTLERGKSVYVCSAEDLIIHKCVSWRQQDIRDVNGVIARQRNGLDVAYIRRWLRYFDTLLPEAEASERFELVWRSGRRAANDVKHLVRNRKTRHKGR